MLISITRPVTREKKQSRLWVGGGKRDRRKDFIDGFSLAHTGFTATENVSFLFQIKYPIPALLLNSREERLFKESVDWEKRNSVFVVVMVVGACGWEGGLTLRQRFWHRINPFRLKTGRAAQAADYSSTSEGWCSYLFPISYAKHWVCTWIKLSLSSLQGKTGHIRSNPAECHWKKAQRIPQKQWSISHYSPW